MMIFAEKLDVMILQKVFEGIVLFTLIFLIMLGGALVVFG